MTKKRRRPNPRKIEVSAEQSAASHSGTPLEVFEAAMRKPTSDAAVKRVVDLLGKYEVRNYEPSKSTYDPDVARTLRWEFTSVPSAGYHGTHLRVRDGVVVGMTLHADIVAGNHKRAVVLDPPFDELIVVQYDAEKGAWAPHVVQRGDQFLFVLAVPQGHWDGTYKFPLTPNQADLLSKSRSAWQELWDDLFRICQSSRFFDDPATLPGDVQSVIDRVCGRE